MRPINEITSAGVVVSVGSLVYDFNSNEFDPWGDIRDLRLSVPIRFRAGQTASVFISPQARWDYEKDASMSDDDYAAIQELLSAEAELLAQVLADEETQDENGFHLRVKWTARQARKFETL